MIKIPLNIVKLEDDNYHLLAEVVLNDEFKTHWVIDTGASRTVMDASLITQYTIEEGFSSNEIQSAGIGGAEMETRVGRVDHFKIGSFQLDGFRVALINLDRINDLYEKYADVRISGLIGSDLLMRYNAVIDYGEAMLYLYKKTETRSGD